MDWISVKDRLPELKQDVLVVVHRFNCIEDGYLVTVGSLWEDDNWLDEDGDELYPPHFWMPLPQPPK